MCNLVSHYWYHTVHQVGHKYLEDSQGHQFADEHFDQTGDIDLHIGADLFLEMLRSGRMTLHGFYPFLQETVLCWKLSVRIPTTTIQHNPDSTFLLRVVSSLEHNLNRSMEFEPVGPSTMTTEQNVCEQHVITHTTQQDDEGSVVSLPRKWIPNNLEILPSLQSEDYIYWNVDWKMNSGIRNTI